jgi:hypothetical protein
MPDLQKANELMKGLPAVGLQVILLLFSISTVNAHYTSNDVKQAIDGDNRLMYCGNLLADISRQENIGNYNQAVRLRQQYAYWCNR